MPGKPIQIKGMPYVPGVAHGVLQHELDSVTSQSILAVSQEDIPLITALPAGFVVIDGAPSFENRGQRAIVSNIRVNCSLTPINSFNTVIELQLVANVLLVSHSFFL